MTTIFFTPIRAAHLPAKTGTTQKVSIDAVVSKDNWVALIPQSSWMTVPNTATVFRPMKQVMKHSRLTSRTHQL